MNGLEVFNHRNIHGSFHRPGYEYDLKNGWLYIVPEATYLVFIEDNGLDNGYECLMCATFIANKERAIKNHLVRAHHSFACGVCSKIDFNEVPLCKEQHQREIDYLAKNMEMTMVIEAENGKTKTCQNETNTENFGWSEKDRDGDSKSITSFLGEVANCFLAPTEISKSGWSQIDDPINEQSSLMHPQENGRSSMIGSKMKRESIMHKRASLKTIHKNKQKKVKFTIKSCL